MVWDGRGQPGAVSASRPVEHYRVASGRCTRPVCSSRNASGARSMGAPAPPAGLGDTRRTDRRRAPAVLMAARLCRRFVEGIEELRTAFGSVNFAVENMFPVGWPAATSSLLTRLRPDDGGIRRLHLDGVHCAASRRDVLRWPTRWFGARSCAPRRRHRRGRESISCQGAANQPCGALLSSLAVVVSPARCGRGQPRRASSGRAQADLAEALASPAHISPHRPPSTPKESTRKESTRNSRGISVEAQRDSVAR